MRPVPELTVPAISSGDLDRIPTLVERITAELVFGVVGPVGSGCSTVAEELGKLLSRDYKYEVIHHRLSDFIPDSAQLIKEPSQLSLQGTQRISHYQQLGNTLRKTFGNSYLAAKAIEKIAEMRDEEGFKRAADGTARPISLRRLHLIDSLKHPEELKLLRETYGDVFWLFGVFAPEQVRRNRLINYQNYDAQALNEVIPHDYKEEEAHGQAVRDTFFQSDFFVRNDQENRESLIKTLERFVEILFGRQVHTPTLEEASMHAAHAEASRSACLSRQVGAVIVNKTGEIIGLGRNDVPKFSGGLYGIEDGVTDNRCYKWGEMRCHNDKQKNSLYSNVKDTLKKSKLLTEPDDDKVLAALRKSEIRSLIEFSRAVHAEMEAIISVARNGKQGLIGSTLFSTTYPCHSCARHILAAGISKVIYIEPYPKSLATTLHSDAISEQESDQQKKLLFLQYSGVAPKNVLRLFKTQSVRKNQDGRLVDFDKTKAQPIVRVSMDDYTTHEKLVVAGLVRNEQRVQSEQQQPPTESKL